MKARTQSATRQCARGAAAVLVAMMLTGPAGASGMPVVDVAHLMRTVVGHYMNYNQNALQYAKEVAQWKQMYDHFQQQLVRGGIYNPKTGEWAEFEKRDPEDGMEETCKAPGILKAGSIAAQQHELCRKIVRAQNEQYNEVVKILETSRKRDEELQGIYQDRMAVGTDQGRLAANENQLQAFEARVQMDLQYASQVMDAYDAYLANLKQDQRRLANQALLGDGALAGVVRGASLKLALQAARGRDR